LGAYRRGVEVLGINHPVYLWDASLERKVAKTSSKGGTQKGTPPSPLFEGGFWGGRCMKKS